MTTPSFLPMPTIVPPVAPVAPRVVTPIRPPATTFSQVCSETKAYLDYAVSQGALGKSVTRKEAADGLLAMMQKSPEWQALSAQGRAEKVSAIQAAVSGRC